MGKYWQSEEELFALLRRELFTAVVGDVMDKLGLQRQFLPPQIRPLSDALVVIGRAMPVLTADVFGESETGTANPLTAKPFGVPMPVEISLRIPCRNARLVPPMNAEPGVKARL